MKAYWKYHNHQQKEIVSKSCTRRYRTAYPNCSMKNEEILNGHWITG
jgi:hypothetical protein